MIVFFILVVLIGALAEWLSLRRPVEQVEYRCRPRGLCHEPDQEFVLETILENHGRRSLYGLNVSERFPAGIRTAGGQPEQAPEGERFICVKSVAAIRGRQRLSRKRKVSMPERGHYIFPGATVSSGDFLGLEMKSRKLVQAEELIIYPRREESPELEAVLDGFYGDYAVRRFLIEDPILVRGFHDYTGAEPQRAISWTQSARRGSLMVKEYDYTQDLSATVLLNVYDPNFARVEIDLLETTYRIARSVCEYLEEREIQYRFFHNMVCSGAEEGGWQFPEPGSHLEGVLEALGRAAYFSAETLEGLAGRARRRGGERQAYYLITAERSAEVACAAKSLEAEGALVCVLYAEDYKKEGGDSL